jgi:hypothetical protein
MFQDEIRTLIKTFFVSLYDGFKWSWGLAAIGVKKNILLSIFIVAGFIALGPSVIILFKDITHHTINIIVWVIFSNLLAYHIVYAWKLVRHQQLQHQNPRRPYNAAQARETKTSNEQNAIIRIEFHSIAKDLFQSADDMTVKEFKSRHRTQMLKWFPDLKEYEDEDIATNQSTRSSPSTTASRQSFIHLSPPSSRGSSKHPSPASSRRGSHQPSPTKSSASRRSSRPPSLR